MVPLERRQSFLTLKLALLADAIVSATVGVLSLIGARWLDSQFDLPAGLLAGSGAIVIAYAGGLALLGTRDRVPAAGTRAVIITNLAWATACVVLLFSGWIGPNGLGTAFIVVQVVAVLVFAELQAMALRTSR